MPYIFRALLAAFACALTLLAASRAFAQEPNPDMYLELVETITSPSDNEWYAADGQITLKSNDGSRAIDYFWNSPPKVIDASGFTLTLTIKGKVANAPERVTLRAQSNIIVWETEPAVNLDLVPGQGASNSLTLSARPMFIPESLKGVVTDILITGGSGGVSYRYVIKSKHDDPGPTPLLTASIDDCPNTIVISAYPPLNCHITISGFRKNTADEVEVILPARIDTFGNHSSGIQVTAGPGTQQVSIMSDPYSWGIFILACPSQEHAGMNCYDSITNPGPVSVPIIVRQKGQQDVSLTLSLNAVARGGPTMASGQVRFGNRLRVGDFINIESGTLVSGAIKADWLSALWSIGPVEGTEFVRLCNVWKSEVCLHAQNQRIEAGTISPDWSSAMWIIEATEDARFIRIQNRSMSGQYLHTEQGFLEMGAIDEDAPSAQWWTLQ